METQMKSVRGARGVQMEEVWVAADAVLNRGERPTIERVRTQLGRGSPNTVGPMLDSWYATLAKRLQSGSAMAAESDLATSGVPIDELAEALPPQVLRAARTLWGRARQFASERAEAEVATQQQALSQDTLALQAQRDQFDVEKHRFAEKAEALDAAIFAKDQQILQLSRQLEELKHMLGARSEEAEVLRTDLSKQRIAMDAMRQFTQVKDEEHRKERERIEERATAQERRLLSEIDRARQATKAAEAQLEGIQKQSTKQSAEWESRVRALDEKLAASDEENVVLRKEMQSAKDALQKLMDEEAKNRASAPTELAAQRATKLRAKPPVMPRKTRLKR